MIKKIILFALVLSVSGCSEIEPVPFVPSTGHINDEESPAVDSSIPELVEQAPLLPEPSSVEPLERYTVVVNEVPVKELLFALARDAKINVDINPNIEGVVTINAVEQTLPQILRRISRQVDMRYEFINDILVISPDEPYLISYTIDYVNMSRDTSSSNIVATQISAPSGGGSSGGGGGGNNATTSVTSETSHHFWESLVTNISAILNEEVSSSGGGGIPVSNTVIPNPEAGILTVRATATQHELVQKFIDETMLNAQRQVMIRVTIAEVQLSDTYQAGIDWSLLQSAAKAGFNIVSTTLTGVPVGTLSSFTLDYVDPNTDRDNRLTATIQLLDEFGNVRIMSSPQIMVLNNQTALLKVVENIVYFEIDSELTPSTVAGGAPVTSVDTTAVTVPVGIVMAVTPQISANETVSLNVRPTISRVTTFVNDPNPDIPPNLANPVPQIEIRELESMLRLNNGQIGVLGGLMLDTAADDVKGLPGISAEPGIGNFFKTTTKEYRKTELVIFIQPITIESPSVDGDLDMYKEFLDGYINAKNLAPQPIPRGQ
jgi:MSHA type pilus biogenesis protein MshL